MAQKKAQRTQLQDLMTPPQELSSQEMAELTGGAGQTDLAGGVTGAQASPPATTSSTTTTSTSKPRHDAAMNSIRNLK